MFASRTGTTKEIFVATQQIPRGVHVSVNADDLCQIIGMLMSGHEPANVEAPDRMAEYTVFGSKMVEAIMMRRHQTELMAATVMLQEKLISGLQVVPGNAEVPTPLYPPEPNDMADAGG